MAQFQQTLVDAIVQGIHVTGDKIHNTSMVYVPVLTGYLKSTTQRDPQLLGYSCGFDAHYAAAQEWGHNGYWQTVQAHQRKAYNRKVQGVTQHVRQTRVRGFRRFMKAQPPKHYMRRAYQQNIGQLPQDIANAIRGAFP